MYEEIKKDVEILWEYLCLDVDEIKVECIIGLGSILTNIPKKCAELYKKGLGEYIVFTGNCGKGTEGVISKTEAEIFKELAVKEGVPENKIFIETKATNTYENYKYTKKLLSDNNLEPNSFLIVGKPYQEKRAKAIAEKELINKKFEISCFNIKLDDFMEYVESSNLMTKDDVINEMVGEININKLVPKYGLQTYCELSEKVENSYKKLLSMGYNKYIINDVMVKSLIEKWKR